MAKVLITLMAIGFAAAAPELGCEFSQHRCSIDIAGDGDPPSSQRHIPSDMDIALKCGRYPAKWYYQDRYQFKAVTLRLERVQSAQSGTYACLDAQKRWHNISLIVGYRDPLVGGSDIASFDRPDAELQLLSDNQRGDLELQQLLPASVQRSAGTSFNLTCSPATPDSLGVNITWLHNETQVLGGRGRIKLKRWTLTVNQLEPEDAGTYRCELCSQEQGCVRSTTRLEVIPLLPPVLQSGYPFNISTLIEQHVRIECLLEKSPLDPKITWLHKQHVDNIEELVHRLRNPKERTPDDWQEMPTLKDEPQVLTLGNVDYEDGGWYICLADNEKGRTVGAAYLDLHENPEETTTARTLTKSTATTPPTTPKNVVETEDSAFSSAANASAGVKGPPVFTKELNRLEHAVSGKTVILACPVSGNPNSPNGPNITWTKDKKKDLFRSVGIYVTKRWTLRIEDATTEDSGLYTCNVCNSFGCIDFEFSVRINDRTRSSPIIVVPLNQTVLVNSTAVLECSVMSDLQPTVDWMRVVYRNRSLGLPPVLELKKLSASETNNVLRLKLANVTHDQEGWYTCVASSSLGQSNSSVYLRVVDHLPHQDLYGLLRTHPLGFTVAAITIVAMFLFGSAFIVYMMRRLRREKLLKHRIETVHQWTKKVIIYRPTGEEGSACSAGDLQMPVIRIEKQRTTFSTTGSGSGGGADHVQGFNEYEFPLDSNWEIPRGQLRLGSILGEGAFGRVVMAEAEGLPRSPHVTETIVAVKMVKEEHTDADMASLVREMEVMKMIGKHINIINLLGCCSQSGPLWVIVEYAPHGNLKDFLKQNRPGAPQRRSGSDGYLDDKPLIPAQQLGEKELTKFAFQIARGMEYLASRRKLPKKISLRQKHLIEAFESTRPSLSASDVTKYHRTYARFTNKEKSSREFVAKRATLA